jgi:hypothetical protein
MNQSPGVSDISCTTDVMIHHHSLVVGPLLLWNSPCDSEIDI